MSNQKEEAAISIYSPKLVLLKIWKIQRKTLVLESLFTKVAGVRSPTSLKGDSRTNVFQFF